MAKLVCHGQKYTKGAIAKIERHNERQNEHYGNQDIDLERSHLNYRLMECAEKNYFAAVMKLVDARNNPTGKKLRKDAVVLTEFIISSSNEFFDTLSPERQKEYFQSSMKYLETLFGKKNTIYAVVHNDVKYSIVLIVYGVYRVREKLKIGTTYTNRKKNVYEVKWNGIGKTSK